MRSKTALYSFLAAGILAAACSVLAAGGAARYGALSERAYCCDIGMGYAQDMADILAASHGDIAAVLDIFPQAAAKERSVSVYFDEDMNMTDGNAGGCMLWAGGISGSGGLGAATVRLSDESGHVLLELPVSWQERIGGRDMNDGK